MNEQTAMRINAKHSSTLEQPYFKSEKKEAISKLLKVKETFTYICEIY